MCQWGVNHVRGELLTTHLSASRLLQAAFLFNRAFYSALCRARYRVLTQPLMTPLQRLIVEPSVPSQVTKNVVAATVEGESQKGSFFEAAIHCVARRCLGCH